MRTNGWVAESRMVRVLDLNEGDYIVIDNKPCVVDRVRYKGGLLVLLTVSMFDQLRYFGFHRDHEVSKYEMTEEW